MARVWFITGVSSGFGTEIALKALQSGAKAIGTVRNRQRAAEAVKKIEDAGGVCVELDVTDVPACTSVFKKAESIHGRIDVLVNNAGMSWRGPVEDFSDAEAKQQMDVNFHGPMRVIQASLPGFRERKAGTIVNISSSAGYKGLPSVSMYAASKWALEGLSESLAAELEEYSIRVLIVQPGAFRTQFIGALQFPAGMNAERYAAAKKAIDAANAREGKQAGDPAKAAARIVEAVTGTGMAGGLKGKVLRMPLGPDCVERVDGKIEIMKREIQATREVSMSTDIG